MKTSINKLCIAASILVTAAGISACVDDNKTASHHDATAGMFKEGTEGTGAAG